MPHPLDGARAKILRAEEHLKQLDGERELWLDRGPYALLVKPDTKPDTYCFELVEIGDPPTILGVILGDYVHNLRSALDHLVWQFVHLNGKSVPRHRRIEVYFPVIDTGLGDFWERPPLRWLTVEQVTFIEGFQPYRSRDAPNPLRDLQTFWNADKHRVINAVAIRLLPQGPRFEFNADAGNPKTWFDQTVPFEAGAKVCGYRLVNPGPNPEVHVTNLPVEIAFGETRRAIEDLGTMRDAARDVIEQAAARFFV